MTVEANSRPPIHQRKDGIGFRSVAIWRVHSNPDELATCRRIPSHGTEQSRTQQRCRVHIQIHGSIGMPPQNRSWRHGADLSLKAGLHRLCLALVGNYRENLAGLENLARRHRERAFRYLRNIRKPRFPNLLAAARLIQVDDNVWVLDNKISGWIVERDVPIFSNTQKSNIDWR